MPPLLSLRVFEAVARHLSFTKAAQELHITQSAASHHIKKLEDDFGRLLFERHPRSITLTAAGQAYYEKVHAAFELLRHGTDEMRAPRNASGTLTVGLLASFATRWLAPRLSAFYAAYPDIGLDLRPDIALSDIAQGEVDVAIRYGQGSWPGLHARKLMPERLTVVCAPRLLADSGAPQAPADLLRFPVLASHSNKPFEWSAWSERFGLDMREARTISLHDYNIVVEAAVAGQGIAMGRHRLIERRLQDGSLVEAFDWPPYHSDIGYWLIAPEGPATAATACFSQWLKEACADA